MEARVSIGDTRQPVRDGEETTYRANPKQSRSFQMLQQGLKMSESDQGVSALWLDHVLIRDVVKTDQQWQDQDQDR